MSVSAKGICEPPLTSIPSYPQANRSSTAALIDENGSPLLLANIAGTNAYRQMMLDSINYEGLQWESDGDWYFSNGSDPIQIPEPGDKLAMKAIFLDNLLNIREVATQKLGHSLEITSMVYPRHLNDTARDIFQKVAIENEPGISIARQLGDSYDGAFRAYDFHLGRLAVRSILSIMMMSMWIRLLGKSSKIVLLLELMGAICVSGAWAESTVHRGSQMKTWYV